MGIRRAADARGRREPAAQCGRDQGAEGGTGAGRGRVRTRVQGHQRGAVRRQAPPSPRPRPHLPLHRPQLPPPRPGNRAARPPHPHPLHQAPQRAQRARRADRGAKVRDKQPGRLRGGARGGDREAGQGHSRIGGPGAHRRLHCRQRHLGAQMAGQPPIQPVDLCQVLRRLGPPRPAARLLPRLRPLRRPPPGTRERRDAAGRQDGGHDLQRGQDRELPEPGHDAGAGDGDPHRHPERGGVQADAAGVPAGRGHGRGGDRGDRDGGEHGGVREVKEK